MADEKRFTLNPLQGAPKAGPVATPVGGFIPTRLTRAPRGKALDFSKLSETAAALLADKSKQEGAWARQQGENAAKAGGEKASQIETAVAEALAGITDPDKKRKAFGRAIDKLVADGVMSDPREMQGYGSAKGRALVRAYNEALQSRVGQLTMTVDPTTGETIPDPDVGQIAEEVRNDILQDPIAQSSWFAMAEFNRDSPGVVDRFTGMVQDGRRANRKIEVRELHGAEAARGMNNLRGEHLLGMAEMQDKTFTVPYEDKDGNLVVGPVAEQFITGVAEMITIWHDDNGIQDAKQLYIEKAASYAQWALQQSPETMRNAMNTLRLIQHVEVVPGVPLGEDTSGPADGATIASILATAIDDLDDAITSDDEGGKATARSVKHLQNGLVLSQGVIDNHLRAWANSDTGMSRGGAEGQALNLALRHLSGVEGIDINDPSLIEGLRSRISELAGDYDAKNETTDEGAWNQHLETIAGMSGNEATAYVASLSPPSAFGITPDDLRKLQGYVDRERLVNEVDHQDSRYIRAVTADPDQSVPASLGLSPALRRQLRDELLAVGQSIREDEYDAIGRSGTEPDEQRAAMAAVHAGGKQRDRVQAVLDKITDAADVPNIMDTEVDELLRAREFDKAEARMQADSDRVGPSVLRATSKRIKEARTAFLQRDAMAGISGAVSRSMNRHIASVVAHYDEEVKATPQFQTILANAEFKFQAMAGKLNEELRTVPDNQYVDQKMAALVDIEKTLSEELAGVMEQEYPDARAEDISAAIAAELNSEQRWRTFVDASGRPHRTTARDINSKLSPSLVDTATRLGGKTGDSAADVWTRIESRGRMALELFGTPVTADRSFKIADFTNMATIHAEDILSGRYVVHFSQVDLEDAVSAAGGDSDAPLEEQVRFLESTGVADNLRVKDDPMFPWTVNARVSGVITVDLSKEALPDNFFFDPRTSQHFSSQEELDQWFTNRKDDLRTVFQRMGLPTATDQALQRSYLEVRNAVLPQQLKMNKGTFHSFVAPTSRNQ